MVDEQNTQINEPKKAPTTAPVKQKAPLWAKITIGCLAATTLLGFGLFAGAMTLGGNADSTTSDSSSTSVAVETLIDNYSKYLGAADDAHDVLHGDGHISTDKVNVNIMDMSSASYTIDYDSESTNYEGARSDVVELLCELDSTVSKDDADSAYSNMLSQGTVSVGKHIVMTQIETENVRINITYDKRAADED